MVSKSWSVSFRSDVMEGIQKARDMVTWRGAAMPVVRQLRGGDPVCTAAISREFCCDGTVDLTCPQSVGRTRAAFFVTRGPTDVPQNL